MGDSIDIFATIGTVFGVATSLGFGVTQINSGLHYLFGVEQSTNIQVLLIIFVSILASLSVFLGLDKGVKRLSELNLVLALILLVFVLSLALVFIYSRLLFKILGNIYLTFYHDIQFICLSAKWMDWGMDHFILGLVDFMVTICGYVYRKGFPWSYHSRVYCRCSSYSDRLYHHLDGLLGNAALFSIIHEHQTTLIQAVQQDSSVALFEF